MARQSKNPWKNMVQSANSYYKSYKIKANQLELLKLLAKKAKPFNKSIEVSFRELSNNLGYSDRTIRNYCDGLKDFITVNSSQGSMAIFRLNRRFFETNFEKNFEVTPKRLTSKKTGVFKKQTAPDKSELTPVVMGSYDEFSEDSTSKFFSVSPGIKSFILDLELGNDTINQNIKQEVGEEERKEEAIIHDTPEGCRSRNASDKSDLFDIRTCGSKKGNQTDNGSKQQEDLEMASSALEIGMNIAQEQTKRELFKRESKKINEDLTIDDINTYDTIPNQRKINSLDDPYDTWTNNHFFLVLQQSYEKIFDTKFNISKKHFNMKFKKFKAQCAKNKMRNHEIARYLSDFISSSKGLLRRHKQRLLNLNMDYLDQDLQHFIDLHVKRKTDVERGVILDLKKFDQSIEMYYHDPKYHICLYRQLGVAIMYQYLTAVEQKSRKDAIKEIAYFLQEVIQEGEEKHNLDDFYDIIKSTIEWEPYTWYNPEQSDPFDWRKILDVWLEKTDVKHTAWYCNRQKTLIDKKPFSCLKKLERKNGTKD